LKYTLFKRFARLETGRKIGADGCTLRMSKRFERLEVGDKKVSIAITDTVAPEEQAPAEIIYYVLCPFCGIENSPDAESCLKCRQPLKTKFAADYQVKAKLLKRCTTCHSVNQDERRNCWVCGKAFPVTGKEKQVIGSDNVITLTIDGVEYKSTDPVLPLDIRFLMERIRLLGYSKELVDEWLRERGQKKSDEKLELASRIEQTRSQYESRRNGTIIALVLLGLYLLSSFLRSC
jgi:ribosomal protein L40E